MQQLFSQMRHTARYLRVATIEGEAGTGKLLTARTLHDLGPNSQLPFVVCPATQFFQQTAGLALVPRTTAIADFIDFPLVRKSGGGTLVLSQVDQLSAPQQSLLFELLGWIDQRHKLREVEQIPRQIIFLCCQSLRQLVSSNALRSDLASRLTAIRFILPPLRERREDIPVLADIFAEQFSATHNQPLRRVHPQTLPHLMQHTWPGNVRELETVIHSAALNCHGDWIQSSDLPNLPALRTAVPTALPYPPAHEDPNLDRAIVRHIQHVLARVEGNKLRAAKMLGISRSTLYRLLDSSSAT